MPRSSEIDVDVLITGASGFVGRALLRELHGRGLRVTGLTRADADLADAAQVRKVLEHVRPGRVVHLAAALPAGDAGSAPERQWRDTFQAGRNVIEIAGDVGVRHLLVAGSVAELGDHSGRLGTDLTPRPITHYGLCKALLLDVAGFVARRTPMRIDWFRPFVVYGPGQTGSMLVPAAFSAAATGRVADFTDGEQERDFLFIDDLVAWIAAGVASPVAGDVPGVAVHHLGTGVATPVRTVLAAIGTLFPGTRFRLGALARRPGEPACQVAPADESPWLWAPKTSLEEGLAITAAWWRSKAADRAPDRG